MSAAPCSFEIQSPVAEPNPAHVHPDPEVYARMAAVARGGMARRFAFCRYKDDGPADAQLHAVRLVEAAESFLPEVQREAIGKARRQDDGTPTVEEGQS